MFAACGSRHDLTRPAAQDNFGVEMARINLWREAMFRFKRAVEINPADAMAHNNLAVAYEANGDFDGARKEYLEALRLDRSNQYIQKNYSRYVEFLSRNKKRQSKDARPVTASTTSPAEPPGTPAITVSGGQTGQPPVVGTGDPTKPPPVPTPPGGSR